jgi:hypothetical protein
MQGETVKKMRQTLQGQVSLRGRNLTLNGRDLDQAFARFESSQTFNLIDIGAFFFAGPVGLAVTKGYDFATVMQGSEGRSAIRTLVSDWAVERGVARRATSPSRQTRTGSPCRAGSISSTSGSTA